MSTKFEYLSGTNGWHDVSGNNFDLSVWPGGTAPQLRYDEWVLDGDRMYRNLSPLESAGMGADFLFNMRVLVPQGAGGRISIRAIAIATGQTILAATFTSQDTYNPYHGFGKLTTVFVGDQGGSASQHWWDDGMPMTNYKIVTTEGRAGTVGNPGPFADFTITGGRMGCRGLYGEYFLFINANEVQTYGYESFGAGMAHWTPDLSQGVRIEIGGDGTGQASNSSLMSVSNVWYYVFAQDVTPNDLNSIINNPNSRSGVQNTLNLRIKKKYFEPNNVDEPKILLNNNAYLKAKKADGTEKQVVKVNTSGKIEFADELVVPAATADTNAVNKGQLTAAVAAEATLRSAADASFQAALSAAQGSISAAISAEATSRGNADSLLQSDLSAEESARIAAVSAEATSRAAADSYLQGQIDNLNTGSSAAVQSLESALAAEITSRAAADVVLQGNINTEKSRIDAILLNASADVDSFAELVTFINSVDSANDSALSVYMSSNNAALAAEVSSRSAADSSLQSALTAAQGSISAAIAAEALARGNADTSIQAAIAAEQSARIAAVSAEASAMAAAVAAEATSRAAADQGLSDSLAAEVSSRVAAVSAEASARSSADTSIQAAITAEASAMAAAVAAEASARGAADTALSNALSAAQGSISAAMAAEQSARIAADTSLSGALSAEATSRGNADTSLSGAIATEKSRIDAILLNASSDKDSFAELVTFINSVDSANDSALSVYMSSNNAALAAEVSSRVAAVSAEASARGTADSSLSAAIAAEASAMAAAVSAEATLRTAADTALDSRVSALEAVVSEKESFTLSSQDITNGYIELAHAAAAKSTIIVVDRMSIHEGLDYTVSLSNGKTRITFIGSMIGSGVEALVNNDVVFVEYMY